MKPPKFIYCDPDSLAEAVALKSQHGLDSLILAGGQSLMPMLNIRLAKPDVLIDINKIKDLQKIERRADVVEIGAGIRQYELESDPLVRDHLPLLAEATGFIGHLENRHRGTVGGSLAHADSAAELPCTAVTLDATVVVQGPAGTRAIPAGDFFQGWMTTALEPDEILIAVRYPVMSPSSGHGFAEVARREGDFALAGAAAVVSLGADGTVASLSVGVASISDKPMRARAVEDALVGQQPAAENVAAAAKEIVPEVGSSDDIHATAAYRKHVAAVVVRRAITAAVTRAQEKGNRK